MLTVNGAYALLWKLSEDLERSAPGWRHSLVVWRTSTLDRKTRATVLANLCAHSGANGLAIRAVVYVLQLDSRAAKDTLDLASRLERKLRDRGYDIATEALAEQPVLATRSVSLRELRSEHLFLSDLTESRVSPLPRGITTALRFSKAVAASSCWWLHESEWTTDRRIRICGREASAHARVRVAPPTSSMESEISIQVWLPWSGRGRRPRWVEKARALLARQLRAGGLSIRRMPSQPSLILASRDVPRSAKMVMRVARELGALPLGEGRGAS